MPSFQTPPDWWVSLANLTQWVDWDAWGAILSAAAVATALWVAFAPRRDAARRRREAMRTFIFIAGSAHGIGMECLRGLQANRATHADFLIYIGKTPAMRSLQARLMVITQAEMIGTQWSDLAAVVDIFLSDWEARMGRYAKEDAPTAERLLHDELARLDERVDRISDYAVNHGATPHPYDDEMVKARLGNALARAKSRAHQKVG